MTHYTIDYSTITDLNEKRAAAIRDIREYLGDDKFDYLTCEFAKFDAIDMPLERMELMLTLAGISGYPVEAWHEYVAYQRKRNAELTQH